MILYNNGKGYWEIAQRYHQHRTNPAMRPTAVRDMQRLLAVTTCESVRRRITSFIAKHKLPGNPVGPRSA